MANKDLGQRIPPLNGSGTMTYFSEREHGERAREQETISEGVWGGIRALVLARVEDGSFGTSYPESCPDGAGPVGTNESALWEAMHAEIPVQDRPWYASSQESPATLDVLDMIEFCWRCVGKPVRRGYHDFFKHYHLSFDVDAGRQEFRDSTNRIFRRNGIAYELTAQGCIERLAPPVLHEHLASMEFRTSDPELNRMLETARRKFLDPDEVTRREALEALWDAWERLKTLGSGSDKKAQTAAMLDTTAGPSSPKFREVLEREAKELTAIGNNLQIRHSETSQERIARMQQVDYLFHRLFALIRVILRTNAGN
jgi:AbiJ N-terminal domain 4